jgi:plastocyanin
MEYAQTVLVQIEANKIDDALRPQGLLEELDEHRRYLQQRPGFREIRVTRSVNPQGNVLVVVETRWDSDQALVDYETQEPNVASIIAKYRDLIIEDTLQVLDLETMQAGTGSAAEEAEQATDRLAMPVLIPLGILAFALVVIYGLSRIYLEVSNEVATGLAIGIALGVLAFALMVVAQPQIQAWQIASVMVLAAGLLAGGTIYALIDEDEGEAHAPAVENGEEPPPDGGGGGADVVSMQDNFFQYQGQREPAISAAAGSEVTLDLVNDGLVVHNMHIAGPDNDYGEGLCEGGGEEPCSDPAQMDPGVEGTITFSFEEAGEYVFRCDFHPVEMIGTIVVE